MEIQLKGFPGVVPANRIRFHGEVFCAIFYVSIFYSPGAVIAGFRGAAAGGNTEGPAEETPPPPAP